MKKIAIIGLKGLPAFGGAARSIENVINCISDDYDFYIYSSEMYLPANYNKYSYKQIIFKSCNKKSIEILLYYIKSMLHALFKGRYDLIHVNHNDAGFIIPLLRIRYRVIYTFHGGFKTKDIRYNFLVNIFFRFSELLGIYFSNQITSVSLEDAKKIENSYNVNVLYIPNGVELNYPITKEESSYKEISLLFAAARIYELKGCHILLEALEILKYKNKVVIIGEIIGSNSYKDRLLELSQLIDVDFIGLLKDKNKLFELCKKANIFVFPSLQEGMSNMLLEIASMKIPIICSNIESNLLIFEDDEVLYFDSGNPIDLSRKIEYAFTNKDIMQKKATNAYLKLKNNFNILDISNSYSKLYNRNIF